LADLRKVNCTKLYYDVREEKLQVMMAWLMTFDVGARWPTSVRSEGMTFCLGAVICECITATSDAGGVIDN